MGTLHIYSSIWFVLFGEATVCIPFAGICDHTVITEPRRQ